MSYQSLKYNITANKGIDFTLYLRYLDENDSVVDLVGGGYTAEMQVRRFAESDTKLLQFISTNGGASVFGPSGEVSMMVCLDLLGVYTSLQTHLR